MKKILVFFVSLFLLITSCKRDTNDANVSIFGFKNIDEARLKLGKYADLFSAVNGSTYVSSIRYNGTNEGDFEIFARYNEDHLSPRTDGGNYFINSNKMIFDPKLQTYVLLPNNDLSKKELGNLLKPTFGKENEAKLIKNDSLIFQTKFYVPTEIVATNLDNFPKLSGSDFIKISRKNMTFHWNRDNNNNNGVVAYLSWTGDRTDIPANEQGTAGKKDAAIKFDDNGLVILPNSFFDDLPVNAAFTISLIRGNVEVLEGSDKKKYKFHTNSWFKIQCTLID